MCKTSAPTRLLHRGYVKTEDSKYLEMFGKQFCNLGSTSFEVSYFPGLANFNQHIISVCVTPTSTQERTTGTSSLVHRPFNVCQCSIAIWLGGGFLCPPIPVQTGVNIILIVVKYPVEYFRKYLITHTEMGI
jgi:hypothetical protein